jgi:head-tail adaptor
MNPLSAAELSRMQSAQTSSLMDACCVQAYASTADSYGALVASYTDGASIACGLHMTGGRESWRNNMTATRIDATIRLPIGTVIKTTDRIKVTHRYGVALGTALVFEIVGAIRRGPSGLQVDLLAVAP